MAMSMKDRFTLLMCGSDSGDIKVRPLLVYHPKSVLSGAQFTAESAEAMQIKCLAQGNNILMSGRMPNRQPLYPQADILTT